MCFAGKGAIIIVRSTGTLDCSGQHFNVVYKDTHVIIYNIITYTCSYSAVLSFVRTHRQLQCDEGALGSFGFFLWFISIF